VNFLNIGPSELIVIVVIAILLVGPRRMVQIARTIGRTTGKMRKISNEFMAIVRREIEETEREAREALEMPATGEGEAAADIRGELQAAEQETEKGLTGLVEGGLGLSTLKDELQAAGREAREYIERVAEEAEAGESVLGLEEVAEKPAGKAQEPEAGEAAEVSPVEEPEAGEAAEVPPVEEPGAELEAEAEEAAEEGAQEPAKTPEPGMEPAAGQPLERLVAEAQEAGGLQEGPEPGEQELVGRAAEAE